MPNYPESNLIVPMVPATSAGITHYGYHREQKVLALTFKNGTTYHYRGVPDVVFSELIASKSRGGFVTREVVGKYETCVYVPPKKEPAHGG